MIIGQEYSRANQNSASDPNGQTPKSKYGMTGGRPSKVNFQILVALRNATLLGESLGGQDEEVSRVSMSGFGGVHRFRFQRDKAVLEGE